MIFHSYPTHFRTKLQFLFFIRDCGLNNALSIENTGRIIVTNNRKHEYFSFSYRKLAVGYARENNCRDKMRWDAVRNAVGTCHWTLSVIC